MLADRAPAPPSLSLGGADRGSAPEPPKTAPFGGTRPFGRKRERLPAARERLSTMKSHAPRLARPQLSLRDVPLARCPPLRFVLLRGGLASGRAALPLGIDRLRAAVSRRKIQRMHESLHRFLKRFYVRRRPLGGPSKGGNCRERSEFRACASRYGAEPLSPRPSGAKEGGRS